MQVEFFEAAFFDLNKSFHYYSDIDTELGGIYLKDIERALADNELPRVRAHEVSTYNP